MKNFNKAMTCQNYFVSKVIRSKKFETEHQEMSACDFRNFILNMPVSNFGEKSRENSAAAIKKRYKLEEKPLLFTGKDVTVREWIDDILGYYQVDTLYIWLRLETGLSYNQLREMKIGDTLIPRARLISLVEDLEKVTGKKLLLETSTPMSFLGEDFPLHEIMKFFAYGSAHENGAVVRALKRWKEVEDAYRTIAKVDENVSSAELLVMKLPIEGKKDILVLTNRLKESLKLFFPKLHLLVNNRMRVGDLLQVVYAAKFLGYQMPRMASAKISRRAILEMYREEAGIEPSVSDREVLTKPVKTITPSFVSEADWDLPIHWLEMRLNIQLPGLYEEVEDETSVLELIDWIYEKCNK